MNPFQRARNEALALRVTLLAEHAEESIPAKKLLEKIESNLNLGIDRLPKSATELGNGDACLHRDDKFIYIRNDIDDDQHAALIAHELGHWILDVDKTQQTITSLTLLDNSQGSPGVVKVEAYGARERQELQANVFGREFLLPRCLARKLFEGGLGPSQVAANLGIPLSIVQQQMLDAILLPEEEKEVFKPLHEPSEDQKQAACAKERFVNVVAGPGTGKTSTLINRIKYLVEELKVDPSHILVLTFTNKAAFELVERLRAIGLPRASDIWAGTFHGFGLEFLRKYHDVFGLPNDMLVADKLNSITMLARELPNITLERHLRVEDPYEWLGDVVTAISRLKEELVTPQEYRERIANLNCNDPKLSLLRQDVAKLYEVYDRLLHNVGLVDFADLVAIPAASIQKDRARFSELADKFQYILVDEYQDVTKSMVQLVKQLAQKAKSVWVVGDVRQAIHHWRGASVKSLLRFQSEFSEQAKSNNSSIQQYSLKLNRRSSQEVVDFISTAGESHVLQQQLPLDKTTSTFGSSGHVPRLVVCPSRSTIPEAVAKAVLNMKKNGIPFSEQAALCRYSADVELLAEKLHEQGIPVFYVGELNNWQSIKNILCLMHFLTERQPRALIGLTKTTNLRMPIADINKMLELAEQDMCWQRGRWLEKTIDGITEESTLVKQLLAKLLKGYSHHSNPWSFICDLLLEKRFALPKLEDDSINAKIERLAIWQFAYSVRAGNGDGKRLSIARYLLRRQLRKRIGENFMEREMPNEASIIDAVRILTVHGSKGLEYQAVHIGYLNDAYSHKKGWVGGDELIDIVPPEVLGSSITEYEFEQAIERNNLFYVAVSRAKSHLYFYEDKDFSNNRPPQFMHKPVAFQEHQFTSAPQEIKTTQINEFKFPRTGPLSFEEFETYAKCPLQYWYRFGLGLKREQEYEAPQRARFAIMQALKTIASGNASKSIETLKKIWEENLLPAEKEDPTLWRDALAVFENGIKFLEVENAVFLEPVTKISGLDIKFPWVIAKNNTSYRVIRFSHQGAAQICALLKPMISGMGNSVKAELVNLLSTETVTATASGNIDKTKAMKAAKKFQTGDRNPTKGRHCNYCSYSSICPADPNLN